MKLLVVAPITMNGIAGRKWVKAVIAETEVQRFEFFDEGKL